MNQPAQHYRHEMGGAGNPKEGSIKPVDAVRIRVIDVADSNLDVVTARSPYREVASLVLQEATPPPVPDTMAYMGPISAEVVRGEG